MAFKITPSPDGTTNVAATIGCLGCLIYIALFILVAGGVYYLITDPSQIGAFFGEIAKGFKDTANS